jgi:hypothetical protein
MSSALPGTGEFQGRALRPIRLCLPVPDFAAMVRNVPFQPQDGGWPLIHYIGQQALLKELIMLSMQIEKNIVNSLHLDPTVIINSYFRGVRGMSGKAD